MYDIYVTITTAIIAFVVPLLFQVIISITDKYKDKEISRIVFEKSKYHLLYKISLYNIVLLSILSYLAVNDKGEIEVGSFGSRLIIFSVQFALLVFTAWRVWIITKTTEQFVIRPDELIIDEMFNAFAGINKAGGKKTEANRVRLWLLLEKLGIVLKVKTGDGDGRTVKDTLNRVTKLFAEFLEMRTSNPVKFNALFWEKEYHDYYVKPIGEQPASTDDKLLKDARLLLWVSPEKYTKLLNVVLNIYYEVWKKAVECNNDEIGRYSIEQLIGLLQLASAKPANQLLVRQILLKYCCMGWEVIDKNIKDSSISRVLYHWYIELMGARRFTNVCVSIEYLDEYNRSLFIMMKSVIKAGNVEIFSGFSRDITDGLAPAAFRGTTLFDYAQILKERGDDKYKQLYDSLEIENSVQELQRDKYRVVSGSQLAKWRERFDCLIKTKLFPHFTSAEKEKAEGIERRLIENIESEIKYLYIREVVFAIGAYCIFQNRYDLIKGFWEYKQPRDADAHWMGGEVLPNSLSKLLTTYFNELFIEDDNTYRWDGHHGRERYFQEYFLLLATRIILKDKTNKNGEPEQVAILSLPTMNYQLSDLLHYASKLEKAINRLQKDRVTMLLDIPDDKTYTELISKKLPALVNRIRDEANKALTRDEIVRNISDSKKKQFIDELVHSFHETAVVRGVISKYLKHYQNETSKQYTGSLLAWGISQYDKKAVFFDDWHEHFIEWGPNYGRGLALSEEEQILGKLMSRCVKIDTTIIDLVSLISDIKAPVIIAGHTMLHEVLAVDEAFIPNWQQPESKLPCLGFEGWYCIKRKRIPVFCTYCDKYDNAIFLLAKNKIGKLVQYSPLSATPKDENVKYEHKDIFAVRIEPLSEELMERIIKEKPEWLLPKDNLEEQKRNLMKLVIIEVHERFEFVPDLNFIGYYYEKVV